MYTNNTAALTAETLRAMNTTWHSSRATTKHAWRATTHIPRGQASRVITHIPRGFAGAPRATLVADEGTSESSRVPADQSETFWRCHIRQWLLSQYSLRTLGVNVAVAVKYSIFTFKYCRVYLQILVEAF